MFGLFYWARVRVRRRLTIAVRVRVVALIWGFNLATLQQLLDICTPIELYMKLRFGV